MQSSLKKSLYLGLAALSFASVAAVSTNASAKSYAKAGAETDLTVTKDDANVESTGTNALFTKPGTTKGAKVVASKATMKKLANSGKSADYFWAYRTTTTNKGAVYYKVVSMNGKYRGYVYAGKTEGEFNRGLKKADTVTKATNPTKLTGYYLKNVAKNTLWTAPKNTERHAKKVSLYGVDGNDTFTVDKAETKTRENTLYYHVTSNNAAKVSGWIYAGKGYDANATTQSMGGLTFDLSDAAATSDNSVKVVYRDKATGATVASKTWVTTNTKTKAGDTVTPNTEGKKDGDLNAAGVALADFITNQMPANYAVDGTPTPATYGNTVYVNVTASATSKVQFVADNVNNDASTSDNPVAGVLADGASLPAGEVSATLSDKGVALLSGTKGTQITEANLDLLKAEIGATDVKGSKLYYAADGTSYYYTYTFTPDNFTSDNRLANYGDTLKASVTATLTKGTPGVAGSDNSWITD